MKTTPLATPKICVRVTQKCNLKCRFCLAPLYSSRELPASKIVRILSLLRDSGLHSVSISGGEPLLHDDLEDLLLGIQELDLGITISTNATLISQAHIEMFQRTGCRVKVNLAGGESIHNALIGQNIFNIVDSNVKRLLAKGIPVGINTVVTRKNRQALSEVVSYALSVMCQ